jgi:hypothetical protein
MKRVKPTSIREYVAVEAISDHVIVGIILQCHQTISAVWIRKTN